MTNVGVQGEKCAQKPAIGRRDHHRAHNQAELSVIQSAAPALQAGCSAEEALDPRFLSGQFHSSYEQASDGT